MTSLLYPTDEKARPELKSSEVLESVVGEHDLAEGSRLPMFRPCMFRPRIIFFFSSFCRYP